MLETQQAQAKTQRAARAKEEALQNQVDTTKAICRELQQSNSNLSEQVKTLQHRNHELRDRPRPRERGLEERRTPGQVVNESVELERARVRDLTAESNDLPRKVPKRRATNVIINGWTVTVTGESISVNDVPNALQEEI